MRRREPLVPEMTPLIDVVFILIIFFIVTSIFKKEELALLLNLPSSSAKELDIEEEQITIELSEKQLAFRGEEVTLEVLEDVLKNIEDKKRAIIVRIDEEVIYKRIVQVLDILQKYGLNNLALVTKKKIDDSE
ncbi:ExbD/TolR family protein [Sulfurovum mangrovi]|uniref:ExbD/TolR family protein n=1 Tax=Sulfurovum mangrovi TaxID=2893889 RepID=UPI001E6168DB|nr:biopolymer transporter ExbD [Sulfurovum mangrovi]UFH58822.1 biopolymer transporter ExbD [Sulfurovum mangrovi]